MPQQCGQRDQLTECWQREWHSFEITLAEMFASGTGFMRGKLTSRENKKERLLPSKKTKRKRK